MPARLTSKGRKALKVGWAAARTVEERMLARLTGADRQRFGEMLETCLGSLSP